MKLPVLNEGEAYIGAIGDKNGDVYHVILLPGDKDCGTWQKAMDWANEIGGDLPSRVEQSMLFAGFKDQFNKDWHWSNQTVDGYAAYAWFQGFGNGYQGDSHKDYDYCRARAVRRLPIQ